jgi:threonine dehydratase
MATVTDRELLNAMAYLWQRLKVVIEPTGALAAAALFQGKIAARGKRCGVVLSGGNIDLEAVVSLFDSR